MSPTPFPNQPPRALPELAAPKATIRIELDEKCFLFPAAKNVSVVQLHAYANDKLRIDLVFPYNESKSATELVELPAAMVAEFARKLTDAAYRATSFLMIAGSVNIAFTTHHHGYTLQVGDFATQRDLFLSATCIWRFIGAVCRAADFLAVPNTH